MEGYSAVTPKNEEKGKKILFLPLNSMAERQLPGWTGKKENCELFLHSPGAARSHSQTHRLGLKSALPFASLWGFSVITWNLSARIKISLFSEVKLNSVHRLTCSFKALFMFICPLKNQPMERPIRRANIKIAEPLNSPICLTKYSILSTIFQFFCCFKTLQLFFVPFLRSLAIPVAIVQWAYDF